jgi:hypothetical protein
MRRAIIVLAIASGIGVLCWAQVVPSGQSIAVPEGQPLPEWVRDLEVRVSPYSTDRVFEPTGSASTKSEDLVDQTEFTIQTMALEAMAAAKEAGPEARQEEIRRLRSLAYYASLPDVVPWLSEVAASDGHNPVYHGKVSGSQAELRKRYPNYPIRYEARRALEVVWARIDMDQHLDRHAKGERVELLKDWFTGAAGSTHLPPARMVDIELARTGEAVVPWLASVARGTAREVSEPGDFSYQRSYVPSRQRRCIDIAALIGGPEAHQLLLEMLKDDTCRVECTIQPEHMTQAAMPRHLRESIPASDDPNDYAVIYPVRNHAARVLARQGWKVTIQDHGFVVGR